MSAISRYERSCISTGVELLSSLLARIGLGCQVYIRIYCKTIFRGVASAAKANPGPGHSDRCLVLPSRSGQDPEAARFGGSSHDSWTLDNCNLVSHPPSSFLPSTSGIQ